MNSAEIYQLDVWKGEWGLPSVDINCLQVLAYAKFCKVPLRIKATNNPFRSPNGQLPVLKHQNGTENTVSDIFQFFRKNNYCLDFGLDPKQCAEVDAYESMLKENIFPALQFIWWVDERNSRQVIRPCYAKALPLVLNYYYLSKYEKQAKAMMEALYPTEENISSIETNVYSEAQKCLNLLSTRLGESEYFFGTFPTTLDAIVYSYLAPILKIPLPNAALQNHLKGCTNLENFVTRISVKYFEDEYKSFDKQKSTKFSEPMRTDSENDFPHKTRNQILAGLFATVAMLTYAISNGILEVPMKDDELNNISSQYTLNNQDFYDEEDDEEGFAE